MMEFNTIIGTILIIFSIFGIFCSIIFGLLKLIKGTIQEALKPYVAKLDNVASIAFVQASIVPIVRELSSWKRQTRPITNAMKTVMLKHGIIIDTEGEISGDLSHLIGLSEEDFLQEVKEVIRRKD